MAEAHSFAKHYKKKNTDMKRFYLLILFILLFANNCFASNFIEGFEDIPLMDGLIQNKNDNFSFANEETGIIEVKLNAKKKINFNNIKLFYKQSLSQMGWNIKNESQESISFYRENNVLDIQKTKNSPLKISISLKNIY